jgi:hypothetical protein
MDQEPHSGRDSLLRVRDTAMGAGVSDHVRSSDEIARLEG